MSKPSESECLWGYQFLLSMLASFSDKGAELVPPGAGNLQQEEVMARRNNPKRCFISQRKNTVIISVCKIKMCWNIFLRNLGLIFKNLSLYSGVSLLPNQVAHLLWRIHPVNNIRAKQPGLADSSRKPNENEYCTNMLSFNPFFSDRQTNCCYRQLNSPISSPFFLRSDSKTVKQLTLET